MKENSLSVAFGDSLKEEVVACISDLSEVGLDAIMNDGILKDIPLISTVTALYKISGTIKDRHNLKKLSVFLKEINTGITDDQKRQVYLKKFENDEQFRNQEIEYLYVLLDRYIDYDKPKMLAKLYMAYLDGIITWEEMAMYSEVIDHFLYLDYTVLIDNSEHTIVHGQPGGEPILRLAALGLMIETTNTSSFVSDGKGGYALSWGSLSNSISLDKTYVRTDFGEKLAKILR